MHVPFSLGDAPGLCGATARRTAARRRTASGASFASFGEIVQGRRGDGEDFLITLPVDLWSHCRTWYQMVVGPSRVEATLAKSRRLALLLLRLLGLETGVRLRLELRRNIPIGKGLSSSTADMLAVLRACEGLFGVTLSQTCISRLLALVEPHDALHFPTSVAYNHRHGRLLARFDYTPDYRLVAVDAGGRVCTQNYNGALAFDPGLCADYDALYRAAKAAFTARDDAAIASCARRSTALHVARTGDPLLRQLLRLAETMDLLGPLATHSGTCGALLLPGNASEAAIARVEAALGHLGATFRTRTLAVPGEAPASGALPVMPDGTVTRGSWPAAGGS
jgi:L-threonine kinase